jgi:hypothetical protein
MDWLIAHQGFLAAFAGINGASIVALIIGISYRPTP